MDGALEAPRGEGGEAAIHVRALPVGELRESEDAPDGDVMAKFALAVGSQGNVRTSTTRAWSEKEFAKIVSELP